MQKSVLFVMFTFKKISKIYFVRVLRFLLRSARFTITRTKCEQFYNLLTESNPSLHIFYLFIVENSMMDTGVNVLKVGLSITFVG